MGKQPIFSSADEAFRTTWRFISRLAALWVWTLLALAHVALAAALLGLAWALQVTPAEAFGWIREAIHSKAFSAYLWLGGSVLGAVALYWNLIRWAHRASYSGWLFRYLDKDD